MLKLQHVKDCRKISLQEVGLKEATFQSPDKHGYDYVIDNEYVGNDEMVRLTRNQAISMFRNGIPSELIQSLTRKQMIAEHEFRLKHDEMYAEYFAAKDKIAAAEAKKAKEEAKAKAEVKTEVKPEVKEEVQEESKEEAKEEVKEDK